MPHDDLLIRKITGKTEICRSFSYRLNAGNYESRDFFASQKAECPIEDAPAVSQMLYEFCKAEVLSSVRNYLRDMEAQRMRKDPTSERRIA
jgi:hypothetical protein